MTTRRHKDVDWKLPETESGSLASWNEVNRALLMDIRDQLYRLNNLLHCVNFTSIPYKLDHIETNTKPSARCRRKHVKKRRSGRRRENRRRKKGSAVQ